VAQTLIAKTATVTSCSGLKSGISNLPIDLAIEGDGIIEEIEYSPTSAYGLFDRVYVRRWGL
jgi:hypothetical protein